MNEQRKKKCGIVFWKSDFALFLFTLLTGRRRIRSSSFIREFSHTFHTAASLPVSSRPNFP
jgi:hypothetical protein